MVPNMKFKVDIITPFKRETRRKHTIQCIPYTRLRKGNQSHNNDIKQRTAKPSSKFRHWFRQWSFINDNGICSLPFLNALGDGGS